MPRKKNTTTPSDKEQKAINTVVYEDTTIAGAADILKKSAKTVEGQLSNLRSKYNVRELTTLVYLLTKKGLL